MVNGYGREVVLDHGRGIETCYGHMSGFAVMGGQTVVRGQVIGYVGHSGRTTGNHVHYEVRVQNTAVNPHKYLRRDKRWPIWVPMEPRRASNDLTSEAW